MKPITIAEMKEYFRDRYPHIDFDITDRELTKWLAQKYLAGVSLEIAADLLADKLLAGGAYAQE